MVLLSVIQKQNANFAAQKLANKVAVFIGATSGIGAATLEATASFLTQPTFVVVGRSASRFSDQRKRLEQLNPHAKLVFIEAEITRLTEVDRVCRDILATQSRIDYLYMSSGYLPASGPQATGEGLEKCYVLSYYARIRFVYKILPLLRESPRPRVLSVLNAGREGPICEEDLALKEKWTMLNLVNNATTFMTLMFYRFAEQNKSMAFVHSGPGLVSTAHTRKPALADSAGYFAMAQYLFVRLVMWFSQAAQGMTPEESGQRHANLLLTSETFGPGAWRVKGSLSEEAPPSELVEKYQREGWQDKAWEFTQSVWSQVLGSVD